jgi:gamma-glutamyltranspeptidase/glutathione hydrolase
MFTTRPELIGTFGAVTSTHWLASAVGMAMLERGGNAFDAAVAAGFTLQVCEPHLNGLGGDLPVVFHSAGSERVQVLCAQGVAPARATIAHYRSEGLSLIPGTGLLATVVPGAFDGWLSLLRDHGVLGLATVLEPAIFYAREGVPVVAPMTNTIAAVKQLFKTEWPTSAAVYLPGGHVPRTGTLFANPTLAVTYERLRAEAAAAGGNREAKIEAARRAFYEGFVAESMDRFCREHEIMDSSGARHRGVLSGDDMARWRASYEPPTTYDYHGYQVCKTGPWGQGPVLLQQLALLRDFDLAAMGEDSADFVHAVVEAGKLAFADRERYYGDPAFVDVPVSTLLSDAYNTERRTLIDMHQASLLLRPGQIDGYGADIDYAARVAAGRKTPGDAGTGEPTVARDGRTRGDTVHVSVIDRQGNMVAATPSGGWLQSSPVIPDLGLCLNSRAQMFWLDEGMPASLAPGKRPRTTLTPSLALHEGIPYMAFGTPGGDQQDQWQLSFFLRHVHFGSNLQEAIDAPSFHSDHAPSSFAPRAAHPGSLTLEQRLPKQTQDELARRGHKLRVGPAWFEGRLCAVSRKGGILRAGANPRGMQGYAIAR